MGHVVITENVAREQTSIGAGGASSTSITFEFFEADGSDVDVYVDAVLQTDPTNYSITPTPGTDGGYQGGTINWVSTQTNVTVTAELSIAFARSSDFPVSGSFNITTLNTQLDKLWAGLKQVEEVMKRSVKYLTTDTVNDADDITWPVKATRASKFAVWDSDGKLAAGAGTVSGITVSAYMATVLDDLTSKAARVTLGSYPSINVKTDHGALGDASTDDTVAFQAAIDAMTNGDTLYIPGGDYILSTLDFTGKNGIKVMGGGGEFGTRLYFSAQTSSTNCMDLTGCRRSTFENFSVMGQTTAGADPTFVPTVGILVAESSTQSSVKNDFRNVRTAGRFSSTAWLMFGATNSAWYSCVLTNDHVSGFAAYLGKTNATLSPTSAFDTVKTSPAANTENNFFGCEFHDRNTDATGTVGTMYLDGARTANFHGCLIENGTASGEYVRMKGLVQDIWFFGCKFYSETGTATAHIFDLDASASVSRVSVIGCIHDEAPEYSGNFVNIGSGAIARQFNIQGWDAAQIKTNQAGGVFLNLAQNKNLLRNADFRIKSRGTAFTSATTPANNDDQYLADGWILLSDGNDIVDVNILTDGALGTYSYLEADVETVQKKFGFLQIVEHRDCLDVIEGNNHVTLQFKAKVSDITKLDNIKAVVLSWDGSADTVTSDVVSAWNAADTTPTWATNWTAENTPANLSVTAAEATYRVEGVHIDTSSVQNLAVFIWSDAVADNDTATETLHITDLELVAGADFVETERRTYQEEFDLCQRFLPTFDCQATSDPIGSGHCPGATSARCFVPFQVEARSRATAVVVNDVTHFAVTRVNTTLETTTGLTYIHGSKKGAVLNATVAAGMTSGQGTEFYGINAAAQLVFTGAEL